MTLSLVACTDVILNEIGHGLRMSDIASTYGAAIVSEARGHDHPDWRTINEAIIAKWGKSGLARVKNGAWKRIDELHRRSAVKP